MSEKYLWKTKSTRYIYLHLISKALSRFNLRPNVDKAITMRRKSPPSENMLYLIENHCQTNISKGRRGHIIFNIFS